jgi:hypothetical protein
MQKLAAHLLALALALLPGTALAQSASPQPEAGFEWRAAHGSARAVLRESWLEEWDPALGRWVRVSEPVMQALSAGEANSAPAYATATWGSRHGFAAQRYAMPFPQADEPARPAAAEHYGPFRMIDAHRAALVGSTDAATPGQFDAMLRDYPELSVIELVEAPGTSNDIANLALGRRIRAAGITTHVPDNGSVRSGAVELFLAGADRSMEPGALFAVHSWLDTQGREADDFGPDAPAHAMYIDYYVEMGLSERRAREFYAMTNSVPHASALWLGAEEMHSWIAPERERPEIHHAAARAIAAAPVQALSFKQGVIALPSVGLAGPVPLALLDVGAVLPAIEYADMSAATLARLETALRES